jgi:hypothetical protein
LVLGLMLRAGKGPRLCHAPKLRSANLNLKPARDPSLIHHELEAARARC